MGKKTATLLPASEALLRRLGDRLRLARRRRRLTANQVAERAGMAPMTLRGIERGGSGATMGAYLAVMQVLGVEKDVDLIAAADPLGRELQDARLATHREVNPRSLPAQAPVSPPKARRSPRTKASQWPDGGFESSRDLAGLIKVGAAARKKR